MKQQGITWAALLALSGCGSSLVTPEEKRAGFVADCSRDEHNVVDCTDSAFRLYPDNPQGVVLTR